MKYDRKEPCPIRHENGNCICVGGFCTAVPDPVCEGVRNAYDCGWTDCALKLRGKVVRRGRWKSKGLASLVCSRCGYVDDWKLYNNFCPGCGADMREEK